jgi:hypothetical protein
MPSALKFLQTIHYNKLNSVFLYVEVVYRLCLCLPVANCSAERTFSNLKRVNNEIEVYDEKSTLKRFSINDHREIKTKRNIVLKEINTDEIIVEFLKKYKIIKLVLSVLRRVHTSE